MESGRRPTRRDPRAAVAALTAALFASAWLAVAAWGSRDSAQPVGSGTSASAGEEPADSGGDDGYASGGSYDGGASEPSMSSGQS